MMRPHCRYARWSIWTWLAVIIAGWLTLWVCSVLWPGWPVWMDYSRWLYP